MPSGFTAWHKREPHHRWKVVAELPRERRRNRGAPAEAVIAESGLLARLRRIGDADEAVLGVPGIIALPVGGEIAVGVV